MDDGHVVGFGGLEGAPPDILLRSVAVASHNRHRGYGSRIVAARIVDVVEELVSFTVLVRPHLAQLTDRYSERKEDAVKLTERVKLNAI